MNFLGLIIIGWLSFAASAEVTEETLRGTFQAYDSGCYMGSNGIYQRTAIRIEDHTLTRATIGFNSPNCDTNTGAYVVKSTHTISYARNNVLTLVSATRQSMRITDQVLKNGDMKRFNMHNCSREAIPAGQWVNILCDGFGNISYENFRMDGNGLWLETLGGVPGGQLRLVNSGESELGRRLRLEEERESGRITVTELPAADGGTN